MTTFNKILTIILLTMIIGIGTWFFHFYTNVEQSAPTVEESKDISEELLPPVEEKDEEDEQEQEPETERLDEEEPEYEDRQKRYAETMEKAMEVPLGVERDYIVAMFGEPEIYFDPYYYFPVSFQYDETDTLVGLSYAYAMPHGNDITKEGVQRRDKLTDIYELYKEYELAFYYDETNDYPRFMFVYSGDDILTFEFTKGESDEEIVLIGFNRGTAEYIKSSQIINYDALTKANGDGPH
ncbi:hypothetical protein [Evansella cellulosilytica]|uniref:Uncharacterized protein n=1 Tax=Evansella cellulosilytica (strain ATCC 21833 / DSM 2522 / FERM P-1141 / JCM 9156 / N-4) TaxID=649639 RepID=E6TWF3_EVAC2|nr:hypothetical protein [Evansella cellulosilytica]ADU32216.1 hypothetical protein Bcell_3984 [Evansella cellulosilytica DSM 2522]